MLIVYYEIDECYYVLIRVCDSCVMWLMIEKWILNDKVVELRELCLSKLYLIYMICISSCLRSHFLLLSYFAIFGFPLCSWFLCIVCFLCLHASKMLQLYSVMCYTIWNNGYVFVLKKQQERFQLLHDVLCLCFLVNPTSLLWWNEA